MTGDIAARDEDAAAVIAIVTALAAACENPEPERPTSVWADPAYRFGLRSTGPLGWWSSGLAR